MSGCHQANVAEGEFAGVELTFMGLNNQNLHNFLFRGFLKPWEAYTGAKINWIDLAQADYNARLQQAIATGTVDFDIAEMGAPFEGDVCGKGLASEMPDWVKDQIEMDDYVGYLKAPVGTWAAKPIVFPLMVTVTISTIARTILPTKHLPKHGKMQAIPLSGHHPEPGRKYRLKPSSSKARQIRSQACLPMVISIP